MKKLSKIFKKFMNFLQEVEDARQGGMRFTGWGKVQNYDKSNLLRGFPQNLNLPTQFFKQMWI